MAKSPNSDPAASHDQNWKRSPRLAAFHRWINTPKNIAARIQSKIALKMAVASALSLIVAQQLQWDYPFYAVIAAIIVMSSTQGSTLKLGVQRLIGTAIGAIGGAITAATLGSNPWSLGITVFLTFFLASFCKFTEAAKLAGYVSAIVILSYSHSPWNYAWVRFLETLLGIGIALFVNRVIFPTSAGAELRQCITQTLIDLEQLYRLVMNGALTNHYDRTHADALKTTLVSSLRKERELWKEVRQGAHHTLSEIQINEVWQFLIHRIWEHILTMEHTIIVRQQDTFWQVLSPQLTHLSQETSNSMLALATAVKLHKTHLSLPEMDIALNRATEKLNHLQDVQQQEGLMDELLRFFTFFYTMEEVSRKLQRMATTLSQQRNLET
jgi:uncharacterized membrane protein YgaE (UPF0421/DUF939 family)